METVNTEELVKAYIELRSRRDQLLSDYEVQDKALKDDLAKLEAAMLDVCNNVNANSIKTSQGTIMRRIKDRFWCTDWDNFYKFILQNSAVQLLERRIHQTNFKDYMDEHLKDGYPPGINVSREFTVAVRKNSN
jgi:predicted component of viral defense system (DUF524 family)